MSEREKALEAALRRARPWMMQQVITTDVGLREFQAVRREVDAALAIHATESVQHVNRPYGERCAVLVDDRWYMANWNGEGWWCKELKRRVCPILIVTTPPATERTAWEAGRDAAADKLSSMCPKCGGEGWLWGHELVEPPDVEGHDDTRYSCDSEVHEYAAAIRNLTPPEDAP